MISIYFAWFLMVLNMEVIGFSDDTIGNPKQLVANVNIAEVNTSSNPAETSSNGHGIETSPARPSVPISNLNQPSTCSPNGRPVVSPVYEPVPVYSNKGPIARNLAPAKILPIAALTPYMGRWAIKGRVTAKTQLRRFHNAKGDGRVFSFDLLDSDGGEIRATCFNSTADQFIDRIEVGKLYMVSKGTLKPAQKSFNHLKHDFEITLENSSTIESINEDDDSIPQQQFNFMSISKIENLEENSIIDVLGVVVGVSPTSTILRKNGTETEKRTVQLRDDSGCSIELTMWGNFCAREGSILQDAYNSNRTAILAIKAGRISTFSGKSVGTISSTQLLVDPDLPEAQQLRAWFESGGRTSAFKPISHEGSTDVPIQMRTTVAEIKEKGLGRSGKPDWIALKGIISFIKTDKFCYTACPLFTGDKQCNRKVTICSDGRWHCDRCDKSMDECEYRYLLSLQVQDHSGVTWVTAFQEAAEQIMGVSARDLQSWKEDGDQRFESIIQKVLFSERLFSVKVKEETYNDELSLKCSVLKADHLNYVSENKILLDSIRSLTREEHYQESTLHNDMPSNISISSAGFMSTSSPSKYIRDKAGSMSTASPNKYVNGGGSSGFSSPDGSCFKCGKTGHWVKDCPRQGTKRFR
ncbi:hypothetical protein KP509_10G009100 [Ceratopteris richardii]|uniref:Replication protein A subunit n=1 Tax=Ceratopteris richardii TaxID=49495 RepID=A0A8T2U1V3_CERRI|nr:hypothetical protein KP509_10G009100 [Ceratopteris richardii]